MLNAKFYTKHLGHHAWKQLTKGMPSKVKQQAVADNLTTCLTYLHECSRRFDKLRQGDHTGHVPKFFLNYVKTSNLANIIHYLTKYTEHADRVEKGLLERMHAEEDDEDDLMYTSAQLRNSDKLAGRLFRRKVSPHKRHLSDDELDDYAVHQLARIVNDFSTPPRTAREYISYILEDPHANPYLKLKAADLRFGAEVFMLEYGMPEVLDRKALEQMFQDDPPRLDLRDGNHVTQLYKDRVKQLADPLYLPARSDLYPVWPWMDPSWEPKYGGKGAPPPQFYPATWYYFVENAPRPVVELWTQEYINSFADYIIRRAGEIDTGGKKFKIVEIGSRDGRLSYFLRKRFAELGESNIEIYATDTAHVLNEWDNEPPVPVVPVFNTLDAIAKYDPQMVICVWMPPNKDLTSNFREYKSVQEYILIGAANGSIAGHTWETWGLPYDYGNTPPYTRQGWQRFDLKYLSLFQIAQNFGPYFQFGSKTISFRRMPREWRPDRTSEGARKLLKAKQESEFQVMKRMMDATKKTDSNNPTQTASNIPLDPLESIADPKQSKPDPTPLKAESLKAESPKTETPKTETLKTETLKAETPSPKVETPSPKVETPSPKVEAPSPKVEAPKTETS